MTVTTNRTIKGRNPKATWGVKIGGVILHCNLIAKTGNGKIGKGASLFYAIDSEVKFWIPNCVIFRCKDAVPLDGHYRVIVNTDWLAKKKWNISMIREDNTTFTRCFDPEQSSVKPAYDDITMQEQDREETLAEDYGLHLSLHS